VEPVVRALKIRYALLLNITDINGVGINGVGVKFRIGINGVGVKFRINGVGVKFTFASCFLMFMA